MTEKSTGITKNLTVMTEITGWTTKKLTEIN